MLFCFEIGTVNIGVNRYLLLSAVRPVFFICLFVWGFFWGEGTPIFVTWWSLLCVDTAGLNHEKAALLTNLSTANTQ